MKNISALLLTFLGLLAYLPAFAQDPEGGIIQAFGQMNNSQFILIVIMVVLTGLIILLTLVMVYLVFFMRSILEPDRLKNFSGDQSIPLPWWKRLVGKKIPAKDQEEKFSGKALENHSYDGIVELDNFMPSWLQYVFVFSIGFGIIYFINYSVLGWGKTQLEEYQEELQIAETQLEERKEGAVSLLDETNVVYDKTEASLDAGKIIYDINCVACHSSDGGGGVGPNLTDEYWLHGGSISDIFSVIKYGVPDKGMIPWQGLLNAEQIQQVSSYILTMVGTTPLSPKAPQGEIYEPEIEEPVDVLSAEKEQVKTGTQ